MGGTGVEAFAQCWQRLLLDILGDDVKQCASNQRDVGQKIGVARTRPVFPHQHIAPPMIADFNSTPVSANQLQPLFWPILRWWRAGEIVTGFLGGVPAPFERALRAHHDQSSGKGKIRCQRLHGEGVNVAHFDAASGGLDVGKKGVLCNASIPWACLCRLGWLPLTWSR